MTDTLQQSPPTGSPTGPSQSRYVALTFDREPYLIRARRLSRLTIPALFRELGANSTTSEILPWQSGGSYGVNNLAAKIVLAMFPPGLPFIKLKQSKKSLNDLMRLPQDQRGDLKAQIDQGLSVVEQEFADEIALDGDSAHLFNSVRHMIVGGNFGLKINDDASLTPIHLENYVTLRDPSGKLFEFVVETPMAFETLPQDIQDLCCSAGYEVKESLSIQPPICVYSHGKFRDGKWRITQEVWGQIVPGSQATYDAEALPYLFLRMVGLPKENYGRSYCEDYEADLQTLDGLWQIVTEGSAAIARLVTLIKPGGVTNKRAFSEAANGAVITGDVEDIGHVTSEKQADFQAALTLADRTEARLDRVFCVNKSATRNAERVTGEEIQFMAQELEDTLGGAYANQATTFQAPYARVKMNAYTRLNRLPPLPKGAVNVAIITGEAALGRFRQSQTLDEFLGSISQDLGGPQILAPYVRISNFLQRKAAALSLDTDGLIKSEQEVQQEQQQAQQQQLAQNVAPEVVRQGGQMMQNAQQAQLPPPGGGAQQPQSPPPSAAAPQ